MSIHAINNATSADFLDSIETALLAAGRLETIHYRGTSSMVFKVTGINVDMQIFTSGSFYIGVFDGVNNLSTNKLTIQTIYSDITDGSWILISTPKIFAMNQYVSSSYHYTRIVGQTAETVPRVIALAYSNSSNNYYNNSWCFNVESGEKLTSLVRYNGPALDLNGYTLASDMHFIGPANMVDLNLQMDGIKLLYQEAPSVTHTVYGDDVGLLAEYTDDGNSYTGGQILIIGGNL